MGDNKANNVIPNLVRNVRRSSKSRFDVWWGIYKRIGEVTDFLRLQAVIRQLETQLAGGKVTPLSPKIFRFGSATVQIPSFEPEKLRRFIDNEKCSDDKYKEALREHGRLRLLLALEKVNGRRKSFMAQIASPRFCASSSFQTIKQAYLAGLILSLASIARYILVNAVEKLRYRFTRTFLPPPIHIRPTIQPCAPNA